MTQLTQLTKEEILAKIDSVDREEWEALLDAISAGDQEKAFHYTDELADKYKITSDWLRELYRFCHAASDQFLQMSKDRKLAKIKPLLKHLSKELDPDKPPEQLNLFGKQNDQSPKTST